MKSTILAAALLILAVPHASAATCAHVETGQALDPQPCTTTADYLRRYTAEVTATWVPSVVPDGTLHNATMNGNGTFTNPAQPSSSIRPPITVTDFKKRFTFAERTALLSSTDAGVKVFLDELNTAAEVHLDDPDTVAGMGYVVSLGLLTQARCDAILTP